MPASPVEKKPNSEGKIVPTKAKSNLSASSIARNPQRFYEYFYGTEENRELIRQHYSIYMSSKAAANVSPQTMTDLKLTVVDNLPQRVNEVAGYLWERPALPWENIMGQGMSFSDTAQSWKGFMKGVDLFPVTQDTASLRPHNVQDSRTHFVKVLKVVGLIETDETLHRRLFFDLSGIRTILQASSVLDLLSEGALATYYSSLRLPLLGLKSLLLQESILLPRPLGTEAVTRWATLHKFKYCIPDGLLMAELPELATTRMFLDFIKLKVGREDEGAFTVSASPRLGSNSKLEFFSCSLEDKAYDNDGGPDSWETPQRQNMIATSALLRHLKSFGIETEVLNIIWTRWSVRMSVDFCEDLEDGGVRFCSYVLPTNPKKPSKMFWSLSNPDDVRDLYCFLVRVKEWTQDVFAQKVKGGMLTFMESDRKWQRWANSDESYSLPFNASTQKLPPTPQGSKAGSKKAPKKKKDHPLAS